jgi:hypothetical protein
MVAVSMAATAPEPLDRVSVALFAAAAPVA